MSRNILIDPQRLGTANPNIQFSGSMANTIKLEVLTSGSVQFTGVSGSLLSIVDSLSGSLFAVSDVSGLPILETFSDDRVVMGRFGTNALVVTGSNVGIGTSNPEYPLDIAPNTATVRIGRSLLGTWPVTNTYALFGNSALDQSTNSGNYAVIQNTGGSTFVNSATGQLLQFRINNTNALVIDSSRNVGVGNTTTISALFQVYGGDIRLLDAVTNTDATTLKGYSTSNGGFWVINNPSNGAGAKLTLGTAFDWDREISVLYSPGTVGAASGVLSIGQQDKNNVNWTHGVTRFYTNGTERLRIDSSGNVGINTSPSAWDNNQRVLQVSNGSFYGYSNGTIVAQNLYYNGAWKYIASSIASGYYTAVDGAHQWWIAPAGTAGNNASLTQTMTLNASGFLGIGTAQMDSRLVVNGNSVFSGSVLPDGDLTRDLGSLTKRWANIYANSLSTPSISAQLTGSNLVNGMVLFAGATGGITGSQSQFFWNNSTNRLGIGTSSPTTTLQVVGDITLGIPGTVDRTITINSSHAANKSGQIYFNGTTGLVIDGLIANQTLLLGKASSLGTTVFSTIQANINGNASGYFNWSVAGSEKMRIDTAGNVGIGTNTASARLIVSGSSTASTPTMVVKEGTIPANATGAFDVQNYLGTSLLYVSGSGRVGISTNSPANTLDVRGILGIGTGDVSSRNAFTISTSIGGGPSATADFAFPTTTFNDTLNFKLSQSGGGYGQFNVIFGGTTMFQVNGGNLSNNGNIVLNPVGNAFFSNGNVGIGISVTSDKLAVVGTVSVTGSYINPGQNNSTALGSTSKSWSNVVSTAFSGSLTRLSDGTTPYLLAGTNVSISTGSNGQITISSAAPAGTVTGTGTTNFLTKWTGASSIGDSVISSVGTEIGASGSLLPGMDINHDLGSLTKRWRNIFATSISGSLTGSNLVNGMVLFAGATGGITGSQSQFFWDNTNNRLGVRTSSPSYPLDVSGDAYLRNLVYVGSGQSIRNVGGAGSVYFMDLGRATFRDGTGANLGGILEASSLYVGTSYWGTALSNGNAAFANNVGIGTTNPDARLTLSGSSDLATFYNSSGTKQLTVQNSGDLSFNTSTTLGLVWGNASLKFNGQLIGVQVVPFTSAYVGFSVVGKASQTYALQTWQNSAGTVLSLVDANGSVGLGITTVSSPLTTRLIVSGSSTASDQTMLVKAGVASQTGPVLEVENNVGSTLFIVSGSGNVGVGTNNPLANVHVNGAGSLISGTAYSNVILTQDSTNFRGVRLGYDTSGQIGVIASSNANSSLAFWTNSGGWGERMRLDSAGNLLVRGTTQYGSAKLQVGYGDDSNAAQGYAQIGLQYFGGGYSHFIQSLHNAVADDGNAIRFYLNTAGTAAGSSAIGTGNALSYFMGYSTHRWNTGGSERVRIDSSGNVGVGTTSILARLHLSGSSTSSTPVLIAQAGIAAPTGRILDVRNQGGSTVASIDHLGNLVANTGSFGGDLSVTGNLTVLGSSSIINSTIVNIGDNIIQLNMQSPALSTGGMYVIDSTAPSTGSLIWDSSTDRWKAGFVGSEINIVTTGSTDTLRNKTIPITGVDPNNISGGTAWGAGFFNGSGNLASTAAGTSGQLLQSNGTSAPTWVSPSSIISTNNIITGSGTTNFVSKFTSGNAIGNSSIFDNGRIGINSSSPNYELDIVVNTNGFDGANVYGAQGGLSEIVGYRAINPNNVGLVAGVAGAFASSAIAGANIPAVYSVGSIPLVFGTNSIERVRITSTGDVGIGTTSYTARLFVSGSSTGTTPTLLVQHGVANGSNLPVVDVKNSAGTSLLFVSGSGRTGVGTNNPQKTLHVIGDAGVSGVTSTGSRRLSLGILDINSNVTPTQIRINTTIPLAAGSADFTVNIKGFRYGGPQMVSLSIGWHYYLSSFYNANAISNGGWQPTIQLAADGNGNVVIHLSDPGYWPKLYVESVYSSAYNDSYSTGWTWTDADLTGMTNVTSVTYKPLATSVSGSITVAGLTQGSVLFGGSGGTIAQDNANFFWDDSNNRLGIGNASPDQQLDVRGNIAMGRRAQATLTRYVGLTNTDGTFSSVAGQGTAGIVIDQHSGGDSSIRFRTGTWGVSEDIRMMIDRTGNVGIGTTVATNATYSFSAGGGLSIYNGTQATVRLSAPSSNWDLGSNNNSLYFYDATNTAERMRINGSGNIGVGTTTYTARLHVSGSSTATASTLVARSGLFAPSSAILDIQDTIGTSMFWVSGSSGTSNVFIKDNLIMGPGTNRFSLTADSGGNPYYNANSIHFFTISGGATYKMVLNTNGLSINNSATAAGSGMGLVVASGNVGIGTTSTNGSAKLEVNSGGSTAPLVNIYSTQSSYTANLDLATLALGSFETANTGIPVVTFKGVNESNSSSANGALVISTRLTSVVAEKMRINSTGHVTPGTDNSQDLGSTSLRWRNVYATSISGSLTGSNVSAGQVVVAGTGGVLSGSNNFWWNNTNRWVGIGNSNPQGVFHAVGVQSIIQDSNAQYTVWKDATPTKAWQSGFASGTDNFEFKHYDGSTWRNFVRFDTSGRVGINTTTMSLYLEVSGSDARIHDVRVGRGGGGVSTNTMLASGASLPTLTGGNNVIIGVNAMRTATTAQECVAVGTDACYGNNNSRVGVGINAAFNAGTNSVCVGSNAGVGLGDDSVSLGAYAGYLGGAATAYVGRSAGIWKGADNTAVGAYALGASPGSAQTTCIRNTAIGRTALGAAINGAEDNAALGYEAGKLLTTGDDNVLLGATAGDSITTGNNNIIIGSGADVLGASNDNSIVIGQGAQGLGTNTTVLGNSSTTTTYIPGSVGISTTTPSSTLQLGEVAVIGQDINSAYHGANFTSVGVNRIKANFAVQTMYDSAAGRMTFRRAPTGIAGSSITWTTSMGIDSSGNVGIGVTGVYPTITSRLEVTGSGNTSGSSALHVLNSSNASMLFVRNDGNIGIGYSTPADRLTVSTVPYTANQDGAIRVQTTDGSILSRIAIKVNSSGLGRFAIDGPSADDGTYEEVITSFGGNVGIGVSTVGPSSDRLSVSGQMNVTGSLSPGNDALYDLGLTNKRWKSINAVSGSISNITFAPVSTGTTWSRTYASGESGRLTATKTISPSTNTTFFTVSTANHGAMLFDVGFVVSESGFSVARKYSVAAKYGTGSGDLVTFKTIDTGPYGSIDLTVTFTKSGATTTTCTVSHNYSSSTNIAMTIDISAISSGGAPTTVTIF